MAGRGGSRHKSKPYIESGLLMKLFVKHVELLKNFKGYESLSRNSGIDPKSLVHALDFINDLIELEASCEIHPQPLKNSLLQLLTSSPSLNNTCQSGSLWAHMRAERVNVLLFHFRRLARNGPNQACASALSGMEMQKLKAAMEKVVLREEIPPLQEGQGTTPLGETQEEEPLKEREAAETSKKN